MAFDARVPVTKIQRFSTHDGPGIRTTVFLKGCPLHCAWCHNPETQSFRPQIFYTERFCIHCGACVSVCPGGAHTLSEGGHDYQAAACQGCLQCAAVCPSGACESCSEEMSVSQIMAAVRRDRAFFGVQGGLTLSGGEPMAHPEAALELLQAARAEGIGTALETCGYFPEVLIDRLAPLVDLFLWDFKDSDPERHRRNTGVSNEPILSNLRRLDRLGARIRLRCIIVRGINADQAHYDAIAALAHSLKGCEGVDLLAYHPYGGSKSVQLGREDDGRTDWIPTPDDMAKAADCLARSGISVGR